MARKRIVLTALTLFLAAPLVLVGSEAPAEPAGASTAERATAPEAPEPAEPGTCEIAPDAGLLPAPMPAAATPRCEDVLITTPCAECPETCTQYGLVFACTCEDWGGAGEICSCPR